MSSWRRSSIVAVVVTSLFLVVQLGIPISRLDTELAHRFGWQMFSITREPPQFVVHTPSDQLEVGLVDYMARVRGDIDIVVGLPPHLCEVVPRAVSVTWDEGEYRC